jgi:DNA-binding NarL/FixJ family response regulator
MVEVIRTIIFEDTPIDREGIKNLIRHIPGVKVVGAFDTPKQALSKCLQMEPDLVIADGEIRGDKTVGPKFVRNLRKQRKDVKILGLTRYTQCFNALKGAGCNHVVYKQFLEDEVAAEKFIRETLLELPEDYMDIDVPELTEIEDSILRMIARGHTEIEISENVHYTRRQVRRVKDRLFDVFGAINAPNLVARAYQTGYLNPSEEL